MTELKFPSLAMLRHRLLLLCLLLPAALSLTDVSVYPSKSKNAFVTIFYEGTPRDYEYFLGARVAMHSMRKAGSNEDRVVLVSPNVRQEWRNIFEEDGCRVIQVQNVENPYLTNEKFLDRFKFSLNKLYAWGLTQYERVVMVDADVIGIQNVDELFLCGHFCAVFMNPCHFHTGLLVVKPDLNMLQQLIRSLATLPSHDAADQGFLDNFFSDLIEAPLFNASKGKSELPRQRLNIGYNMHHLYYYEKFNWDLYSCSPIVTLGYPIHQNFKPWYWWGYPIFDIHYWWQDLRSELPFQNNHYGARALFVTLLACAAFTLLKYFDKYSQLLASWVFLPRVILSYAGYIAAAYGLIAAMLSVKIAAHFVPSWLPPAPAWALFLAFYDIFYYFFVCSLGFWLHACHQATLAIPLRVQLNPATKHPLLINSAKKIASAAPVYILCFVALGAPIYGNIIYKAAVALTIAVGLFGLQCLQSYWVAQLYCKGDALLPLEQVTSHRDDS